MANDSELPSWILIQMSTFTNWLNHELATTNLQIEDLREDLRSGITLIRIVEQLQKRVCTGKVYGKDPTEIQRLMNVQLALEALQEDNIKLVNIGKFKFDYKNKFSHCRKSGHRLWQLEIDSRSYLASDSTLPTCSTVETACQEAVNGMASVGFTRNSAYKLST
jgi:hypothetical protein